MKIDRILLVSDPKPLYADFWNPISKVYNEKFGIKTTLIWLGTNREAIDAGIDLSYGEMWTVTPHPDYPIPVQTTLAMFYFTKMFPDEVMLTHGIDEVHLGPMFIRDMIREVPDNHYVQLIDDAYLPNYWANGGTSPSGQHAAKGSTFNEVFNFENTFHEFVERVVKSGTPAFWETTDGRWGLDESYTSRMLREYRERGGEITCFSNFKLLVERRIECERFKEPDYDVNRLKLGWYSQSHLCRPYADHKEWIDNLFNNISTWI